MPPGTLMIRVDGNVAIGVGHMVRCLALAQFWQDRGGSVSFVMAQTTPSIAQYLVEEKIPVFHIAGQPGSNEDAQNLTETAARMKADWIVVDGYQFPESYQVGVRSAGHKVMWVDDSGLCRHYSADIVLNQNINAHAAMYTKREPHTSLLLGSQYVMLRREFGRWRNWQREIPDRARRILVSLGGTDPDGLTLPIARTLVTMRTDIDITVVLGGSNPHSEELKDNIGRLGSRIEWRADVREMASLMAAADVAIVCGGGTLWESLYMGCATITYSRPGAHELIISKLASAAAVIHMGEAGAFDEGKLMEAVQELVSSAERRRFMAERGREVVDGKGTERVVNAMTRSSEISKDVILEPVAAADREEFLRMALSHFRELNPLFKPDADWKKEFFENIQRREGCWLRWIVKDREHVGFILFGIEVHRFLPRKTGAIWELYVVPEKRRMGLGRSCAHIVIEELWKMCPSKIQLEVVDGNERAVALWRSLGFEKAAQRFVLPSNRERMN